MKWEVEDAVMVLFTGREGPRDGFDQKVQVRATPRFRYLEEKFFFIVGTRKLWTLNIMRPFSRSRFERYAFLSYSAADTSSKFIFLDPLILLRTSVLFLVKMKSFTFLRH